MVVRSTPPDVGERTTRIDVYYEGGDCAPLPLTIKLRGSAPEFPLLTYDPRQVIVRGLLGQAANAEFKLITIEPRNEEAWIESLGTDAAQLTASILDFADMRGPDDETVRRQYRCRITAQLETRGRKQLGNVTVHFRRPNDHVSPAVIQVMSDCSAAVEAVPDTVFASLARRDLPRTFTIGFRSVEGSSLVLEPKCDASWIECEPASIREGATPFLAALSVRVVELPENQDTARATISVNTNIPECRMIEIPVVIRKREEHPR